MAKRPATGAKLWAKLSEDDRDCRLLLASGRAMRITASAAVQRERMTRGELGGKEKRASVLDHVTITQEEGAANEGRAGRAIVGFRTGLPRQGFGQGDRGAVRGIRDGKVQIAMADGSVCRCNPDKLPRNLCHDAVSINQQQNIGVIEDDRIRWTDNDRQRSPLNSDIARFASIAHHSMIVLICDGEQHALRRGDRMLERLELADASSVRIAQDQTA